MRGLQCICKIALWSMLLGWGICAQAQSYEKLWKQVEQAQKKSLPQTVVNLTGEICQKALAEKNSPQLLKAYLCRAAFQERLTPDSLYTRLNEMEQWAATETNETDRAILHSILASEYAGYWQNNRRVIAARTDLATDKQPADVREWTPRQFVEKVDAHALASTHDVDRLIKTSTDGYQPFVEQGEQSAYYSHDLYHLLARRAISALKSMTGAGADSLMQTRVEHFYLQMMDTYAARPDGVDACLLATLDYWEWKNGSASQDEAAYLQALDELMTRYADRPLCAEVYLRKAQWMSRGSEGQSVGEAIRLCDEAIRRYASYARIGQMKQLRAELLRPQLAISAEGIGYPGDTLDLRVRYRTMDAPVTLNIYVTNLSGYSTRYDCNNDKTFRSLSPRRVYSRQLTLNPLPAEHKSEADLPYLESITNLPLPVPQEAGVYVVEVVPQAKNGRTSRCLLPVSRLRALTLDLGEGQIEVTTLDGRSGHAEGGVRVCFYSSSDEENCRLLKEVVTDEQGQALVTLEKYDYNTCYTLSKGTDTALPSTGVYLSRSSRPSTDNRYELSLLTDRSIYRPGQTVYLKGVVYNKGKNSAQVVEGEWVNLELLDANLKQIATRRVQTNEFGSFTVDFALPSVCLNGQFMVRAQGNISGAARFQVEEYKRPTFEITFQPVTIPYCLGETVTLRGEVKAFSGASVQEMPLAWSLKRYDRLRGYLNTDKMLKADTVRLDAQGRFAIDIRLEGEVEKALQPWQVRQGYSFEVEAAVTDEAGETQTASYTLSASSQAFNLNPSIPMQVCKEDTTQWMIHASNPQMSPLTLIADWRIEPETEDGELITKDAKPTLSGRCLTGKNNPSDTWHNVPSGRYRLTAWATDSLGHRVESTASFVLFSKEDRRPPVHSPLFFHERKMEVAAGEKASFCLGTSFKDAWVWMDVFTGGKRVESRLLQISDTLMSVEMPYLDSYDESVTLLFNTLKEGELYSRTAFLKRTQPNRTLQMKWEVFRDRLRPGQEEEWRLVVTTPEGLSASAEMLALMYDASLDKLYPNRQSWGVFFAPQLDWRNVRLNTASRLYLSPYFTIPDWKIPGWSFDRFCSPWLVPQVIEIRDDALVIGYGSSRTPTLVGGTVLQKSPSNAIFNTKEEAGLAVEAAYAPPTADDVLFEEEVVNTAETLQPDADLRTNFAETAFFYPQLRTNERGEVVVAFTLPQSLTRWNFRGYTHTKDMQTGLLEASVVSAKEFMLRPNLPRFFRMGDQAQVAATVSNLTEGTIKGRVTLQLFDPTTEKVILTRREKFEAEAGRNAAVGFAFNVDDRYPLLGVRLTADGGNFSDGEQHVLPVLSNQEYVTETLTFDLKGNDACTLRLDTLFNHNSSTATQRRLTVEVTGNPAWMAIQALPSLTQPDGENAISWAVAYYANTLAAAIAQSQPRVREVIEAWLVSGQSKETFLSRLEQNEDLKNMLLSETPWLAEATSDTERMQRLVQLFDANRQRNLTLSALTRLKELQGEDGAWSWYKGMGSSRDITTYIATLLVRLPLLTGSPLDADASAMRQRAFAYLHQEALKEYKRLREAECKGTPITTLSPDAFDYLYLLALDADAMKQADKEVHNYFLSLLPRQLTTTSIQRKAQAAVILQAAGCKADAQAFEASIKEHLVQEKMMGAYFAFNDGYYSWGIMPVTTHVAAMEALSRFEGNTSVIEEMKRWLLKQKQTTQWNTPVASADAIYALLCNGRNWLTDRGDVTLTLGHERLRTTDASARPLQGLGYIKETYEEGNAALNARTLEVEKHDEGMAWGAVYAQYLSPVADVRAQSTGLSIEKQCFVERKTAFGRSELHPLEKEGSLRVGDKLIIRLVLRLDRAMDYVQLKDSRAACLEPTATLSGYRWTGGFGYYAETKDASTRFFFDHLSKGTYVLEYSCRVSQVGTYQSGLATVQCAYAPEMAAHSSAGTPLQVKE